MIESKLAFSYLPAGQHLELAPHRRDPLAQRHRRPDGGRGRVVELVGQAGRERAEREQPLALADRLAGPLAAEPEPLEQVRRHREPLGHDLREAGRAEHEELRRLGHPDRVLVHLRDPVAQVGGVGAGVDAALAGPADLDVVRADPPRGDQGALDEHVEAVGRGALGEQHAGLDPLHVPLLAQPPELLLGQLLEQEQRPELVRGALAGQLFRLHRLVGLVWRSGCLAFPARSPRGWRS